MFLLSDSHVLVEVLSASVSELQGEAGKWMDEDEQSVKKREELTIAEQTYV